MLRVLILFLLTITPTAAGDAGTQRLLDKLYDPNGDVMVAAHRGFWREAPENSTLAVEEAIRVGCEIIEIDVRRTADGHWIVIHDKTLERTTNGSGRVDAHTLDQIRGLRLLNGYGLETDLRVPTLLEVAKLTRGRALLYVDKSDDHLREIANLLDRENLLDHCLFYGRRPVSDLQATFGADILERVHYLPKLGDRTPDAANYIDAFLSLSKPPAAFVLDFQEDTPTTSLALAAIPQIRQARVRVWMSPLWSDLVAGRTDDRAVVAPDENWGWLLDHDATILCTDRPRRMIRFLNGLNAD